MKTGFFDKGFQLWHISATLRTLKYVCNHVSNWPLKKIKHRWKVIKFKKGALIFQLQLCLIQHKQTTFNWRKLKITSHNCSVERRENSILFNNDLKNCNNQNRQYQLYFCTSCFLRIIIILLCRIILIIYIFTYIYT